MTKEVMKQEQDDSVSYIKEVIEALYENSDPVSVEAGELLERINAKQEHDKPESGFFSREAMAKHSDGHVHLKQEQNELVYDLLDDARAVLEVIVHDQPDDTFSDARALIPKLREQLGLPTIINFTTPQTKEWVGLTNEQKEDIWDEMVNTHGFAGDETEYMVDLVITATEAKLK